MVAFNNLNAEDWLILSIFYPSNIENTFKFQHFNISNFKKNFKIKRLIIICPDFKNFDFINFKIKWYPLGPNFKIPISFDLLFWRLCHYLPPTNFKLFNHYFLKFCITQFCKLCSKFKISIFPLVHEFHHYQSYLQYSRQTKHQNEGFPR